MDKTPKPSGNMKLSEMAEKEDRRTKRTRETLVHALLGLIETKPYDFITVGDIISEANVGRSTFYAHYQNKDKLLLGGFDLLLDRVVEEIHLDEDLGLVFDASLFFRHAHGHHDIYQRLVWGSGFKLLIKDGHTALSHKIEERITVLARPGFQPSISLSVVATALSGGLLILLKWWLDRKMPYSPERMNEIFQQLTMPGMRDVLKALSKP
jgi:AcrR family transcriptional regulator